MTTPTVVNITDSLRIKKTDSLNWTVQERRVVSNKNGKSREENIGKEVWDNRSYHGSLYRAMQSAHSVLMEDKGARSLAGIMEDVMECLEIVAERIKNETPRGAA